MLNEITGWSEMKSLKLSRILTYGLMFLLGVIVFTAPIIAEWFDAISVGKGLIKGSVRAPVTVLLYICDALAVWAVVLLNRLLKNISADKVFIPENSACLRGISWACVFVGITMTVFSIWRFEFLFAAFFAMFLGLVMRVLKNVFERAVELQSESDYTI